MWQWEGQPMEWVLVYLGLAVVVGVAANTRGRSGLGWFLLALLISPLISGLLVLALPRIGKVVTPSDERSLHTAEHQIASQRSGRSFEAEGVLRGFPYRVRENGSIEAMMMGGLVRFQDMEQFLAAAEGRDATSARREPAPFDPNNPIVDPLSNLPEGSRIERHFRRRIVFLPDGTVLGETDGGLRKFKTFEEWRRFIEK